MSRVLDALSWLVTVQPIATLLVLLRGFGPMRAITPALHKPHNNCLKNRRILNGQITHTL